MKDTNSSDMLYSRTPLKRKFTWMPRLDFYVLREFLIPFSVILFAFCLLFLIADVFNDLNDFLDNEGGSLAEATRYFILKMPGNIRFILPITVLLSCMYTLANFGRHREITAMRASGISLFRSAFPIYAFALMVTGVNFWFNENLVPYCERESDRIMGTLKNKNYEEKMGARLQYLSNDKMRNWYFRRFSRNGMHEDVKLKFFIPSSEDPSRKIPSRTIDAEKVEFEEGRGWLFHNAKITTFTSDGLYMISDPPSNPYFIPEAEAPERPSVIEKAIILPEDLSIGEISALLYENDNMPEAHKRSYQTQLYYKLSFPWLCFLCTFLALPLAAKNERSGIFMAITSAVIIVVLFYVVSEVFKLAGNNGYVPPIVGGLFPTLVFAGYGIFLARKSG